MRLSWKSRPVPHGHGVVAPPRWRTVVVALTLGSLVVAAVAVTNPAGARVAVCRAFRLPVALAPGGPADLTAAGTLCEPPGYVRKVGQIDVLVPGATYDHRYWDWPGDGGRYSFVRRTLAAKRATFAYDPFGTGESSVPPSDMVTVASQAYLLHQLISWLRNSQQFANVDVIGHSFGAVVGVHEAAVHGDADRLVLTGYLHAAGPGVGRPDTLYPASRDPRFAGRGYDDGYLTTRPGIRGWLFYAATATPAVVDADEAGKDVVSGTLFADAVAETYAAPGRGYSDRVTAPVLLVNGDRDRLYCGLPLDCADADAVYANEAVHFAAAAELGSVVVAETGHDLALHPSADASFAVIDEWLTGFPPRPARYRLVR